MGLTTAVKERIHVVVVVLHGSAAKLAKHAHEPLGSVGQHGPLHARGKVVQSGAGVREQVLVLQTEQRVHHCAQQAQQCGVQK